MPEYTVKDPISGRSVDLEGDSPPTEQELEDIFKQLPAAPADTRPTSQRIMENPALDTQTKQTTSVFPRAMSSSVEGRGALKTLGAAGLDLLSLPGRELSGLASQITGEDKGFDAFMQRRAQTGNEPGAGMVEKLVTSPANIVMGPAGRLGLGLAGRAIPALANAARTAPLAVKLGRMAAEGGGAGAGADITQKAERATEGTLGTLPEELAATGLNVGGGAAAGAAFPLAGRALESVGNAKQRLSGFLGQVAEEQTALPEEILRKAGTKEGLAELKTNKGKAYEIGQKLVDAVYNPIDNLPEARTINEMLPKLPTVDAEPIASAMAKHIIENPSPKLEKVNTLLQNDVEWILKTAEKNGGTIPAKEALNIRTQLDELIQDQYGKDAGKYINALKDARHQIRASLLDAAARSGNQEYIAGMKSLSDKLQLLDKIKTRLGSDVQTGEGRAESFVRNLFNLGRSDLQETMKDFDAVFGTQITPQANAARMAEILNKQGNVPYFTKWPTGRSGMLGKLGALTVGSPKVMSKVLNMLGPSGQEAVAPQLSMAARQTNPYTASSYPLNAIANPEGLAKLQALKARLQEARSGAVGSAPAAESGFEGMGTLYSPKRRRQQQ